MKKKTCSPYVGKEKLIAIWTLYVASMAIMLIGAFFGVLSAINNISIPVLSSQIPGVVFGAVILFLGVRYFLSVRRLKAEVYKSTSSFSWSNFRKVKKAKS